jgi:hypothetical protein
MHRWVAVYLACIAAACIIKGGDQGRNEAVIAVFCKCQAPPLPSAQELCAQDLREELGNQTIPEFCANCILANQANCTTLLDECDFACGGGPEEDDGPVMLPGLPK